MKNKESVVLVFVAIVVAAVSKLYEALGAAGFITLVAVIGYMIKMLLDHNKKEQQRKFNALAFQLANERISPNTARSIFRSGRFSIYQHQQLRHIQLIRESIDIALSSKRIDTAESRMDIVSESHLALLAENDLALDVLHAIDTIVINAKRDFCTLRYTNQAVAYIEKASKLKTEKAKLKYIEMAKAVLSDALSDPLCDADRIQVLLNEIQNS